MIINLENAVLLNNFIICHNILLFCIHLSFQNLRSLFKGADSSALHLLKSMLEFDPAKRISVDQALGHSFLADFHTPGMETSSDNPMDSAMEILRESPDNLKATVSHMRLVLYCPFLSSPLLSSLVLSYLVSSFPFFSSPLICPFQLFPFLAMTYMRSHILSSFPFFSLYCPTLFPFISRIRLH